MLPGGPGATWKLWLGKGSIVNTASSVAVMGSATSQTLPYTAYKWRRCYHWNRAYNALRPVGTHCCKSFAKNPNGGRSPYGACAAGPVRRSPTKLLLR